MARVAWGLVCVSTERGAQGGKTARRVFQVLQTPFTPLTLSLVFLVCLRGAANERLTLTFRLVGPHGPIELPRPASGQEFAIEIGPDGCYFVELEMKNLHVVAFGEYRLDVRRVRSSAPMATVRFAVAESHAGPLPASKPS